MEKHLYPAYPKGIKLVTDFPVCWVNPEYIYNRIRPYYDEDQLSEFFDKFHEIMKRQRTDEKYRVTDSNKEELEKLLNEYKLELRGEKCRFCSYGDHVVYEVEVIDKN